jgi:hypothetical protein
MVGQGTSRKSRTAQADAADSMTTFSGSDGDAHSPRRSGHGRDSPLTTVASDADLRRLERRMMCIERRSSRSPRPWHRHLPWHLITGAPHRVPNLFPWAILIAFTGSIMTVAFAYAAEAIKVRRTSPLPRSLLCQLDSPPLRCAGPAELKPVELSVVRPNCSWWDEYTRSSPVGCFGTRKISHRADPPAAPAAGRVRRRSAGAIAMHSWISRRRSLWTTRRGDGQRSASASGLPA